MDSQTSLNVWSTLPSGDDIRAALDALMCFLFAHANKIALGTSVVTTANGLSVIRLANRTTCKI